MAPSSIANVPINFKCEHSMYTNALYGAGIDVSCGPIQDQSSHNVAVLRPDSAEMMLLLALLLINPPLLCCWGELKDVV